MKSVQRCVALAQLLTEQNFPAIAIHRGMTQEERLSRYQQFKDFQKVRKLLLVLNLFYLLVGIPEFSDIGSRYLLHKLFKQF